MAFLYKIVYNTDQGSVELTLRVTPKKTSRVPNTCINRLPPDLEELSILSGENNHPFITVSKSDALFLDFYLTQKVPEGYELVTPNILIKILVNERNALTNEIEEGSAAQNLINEPQNHIVVEPNQKGQHWLNGFECKNTQGFDCVSQFVAVEAASNTAIGDGPAKSLYTILVFAPDRLAMSKVPPDLNSFFTTTTPTDALKPIVQSIKPSVACHPHYVCCARTDFKLQIGSTQITRPDDQNHWNFTCQMPESNSTTKQTHPQTWMAVMGGTREHENHFQIIVDTYFQNIFWGISDIMSLFNRRVRGHAIENEATAMVHTDDKIRYLSLHHDDRNALRLNTEGAESIEGLELLCLPIFLCSDKHNACPLVIARHDADGKVATVMWHVSHQKLQRCQGREPVNTALPKLLFEEPDHPSLSQILTHPDARIWVTSPLLLEPSIFSAEGVRRHLPLPPNLLIVSAGLEGNIRSYSANYFPARDQLIISGHNLEDKPSLWITKGLFTLRATEEVTWQEMSVEQFNEFFASPQLEEFIGHDIARLKSLTFDDYIQAAQAFLDKLPTAHVLKSGPT